MFNVVLNESAEIYSKDIEFKKEDIVRAGVKIDLESTIYSGGDSPIRFYIIHYLELKKDSLLTQDLIKSKWGKEVSIQLALWVENYTNYVSVILEQSDNVKPLYDGYVFNEFIRDNVVINAVTTGTLNMTPKEAMELDADVRIWNTFLEDVYVDSECRDDRLYLTSR